MCSAGLRDLQRTAGATEDRKLSERATSEGLSVTLQVGDFDSRLFPGISDGLYNPVFFSY